MNDDDENIVQEVGGLLLGAPTPMTGAQIMRDLPFESRHTQLEHHNYRVNGLRDTDYRALNNRIQYAINPLGMEHLVEAYLNYERAYNDRRNHRSYRLGRELVDNYMEHNSRLLPTRIQETHPQHRYTSRWIATQLDNLRRPDDHIAHQQARYDIEQLRNRGGRIDPTIMVDFGATPDIWGSINQAAGGIYNQVNEADLGDNMPDFDATTPPGSPERDVEAPPAPLRAGVRPRVRPREQDGAGGDVARRRLDFGGGVERRAVNNPAFLNEAGVMRQREAGQRDIDNENVRPPLNDIIALMRNPPRRDNDGGAGYGGAGNVF